MLNVREEELIERAHDLQPELTDLKELKNATYFYLMGMLLARQGKAEIEETEEYPEEEDEETEEEDDLDRFYADYDRLSPWERRERIAEMTEDYYFDRDREERLIAAEE